MAVLAVDVGGTNIRTAVFDAGQTCGPTTRIPLRQWGFPVPPDAFVEHVAQQVTEQVTEQGEIEAVGVGLAAVVDRRSGKVKVAENIGWRCVPIRELLEARLGLPVCVEVDAYCGTLAEARLGSGADVDSFLYVVIGTGIGHGLMLDGALWRGLHGSANVFGHLRVVNNGARCYCGGYGCLCQYSSGEGIARLGKHYRGSGPALQGQDVIDAYCNGEGWAAAAVKEALQRLATAISHVHNLLDIECVIFAGGAVSNAYPQFTELEQLVTRMVHSQIRPIEFRHAALGSNGVLHGAALLATDMVITA